MLFRSEEVKERDKKELLKLGEWLESQAERNIDGKEEANSFDLGRLYMYIMIKAKDDRDFYEWWSYNSFNVSKYAYDYRNEYLTIRTGTGT